MAFARVVSGATGYSRNRSRSVSTVFAAPGLPRDCVTFGVGLRDPLQFRGGQQLDELLHVGLTRATTKLVVIAPPALARRLS